MQDLSTSCWPSSECTARYCSRRSTEHREHWGSGIVEGREQSQVGLLPIRYMVYTSQAPQAVQITLRNVCAIKYHKEAEDSHEDVDPPEINTRDRPRRMEAIEEWLRGNLGMMKIPLACVL